MCRFVLVCVRALGTTQQMEDVSSTGVVSVGDVVGTVSEGDERSTRGQRHTSK